MKLGHTHCTSKPVESTCKDYSACIGHSDMQDYIFSGYFSVPRGRKVSTCKCISMFFINYFIVYILTCIASRQCDHYTAQTGWMLLLLLKPNQNSLLFRVNMQKLLIYRWDIMSFQARLLSLVTIFLCNVCVPEATNKHSLSADAQTNPYDRHIEIERLQRF